MNPSTERHTLHQELDRASEVKMRLVEEARRWVQTANQEIENAEACLTRWEKATPYEVLEHEAYENKRSAERAEAEQERKISERDAKEDAARVLLVRGATNVATALVFLALLASVVAPFALPEYAAKHLIVGIWAALIVSMFFCR